MIPAETCKGIIGGWIDISERRQLFEELRAAKERADEANRAKSTFLATMSHEIRTPMNAVIGMLELTLRRMDQQHPDRTSIDTAYHSAKDLLGLIGDILDIARIESGRLSLCPERVNLVETVASVTRIFDGLARQKNLALHTYFNPPDLAVDVQLDPLRFKQVLSNLISNAIKFTEQGQIRITLDLMQHRGACPCADATDRAGQRRRHQCRGSAALVRTLCPGGKQQSAGQKRRRPRSGDQSQPLRNDGRPSAIEQPARHRHAGLRFSAPANPAGPGEPPSTGDHQSRLRRRR